MTRNCPKIHFNIVKNYVSAERKVIRHVINDVITNYTEPRGVDTTLDDFIRKINSILLRGVDISPNNFVRKINSILPPKYELLPCDFVQKINSILPPKHELLPCDFVQKINSILPPKHELLPCDFVQKTNFKYPHQKRQSRQGTAHILTSSILFFNQLYC